jgi:hypothetical protein
MSINPTSFPLGHEEFLKTGDQLPLLPEPVGIPIHAGFVHEWFVAGGSSEGGPWHPPLTILAALAWKLTCDEKPRRVVWIGRRCWPTFQLIESLGDAAWQKHSLFLNPQSDNERFWVIGQALRCRGIQMVIADGSRMTATVSRRLQLAAEGNKTFAMLARPMWERSEPSYAATRWEVTPRDASEPGWSIKLLSCRGQRHGQDARQDWNADWSYQVFRGTGTLCLLPSMGRGIDVAAVGTSHARTA